MNRRIPNGTYGNPEFWISVHIPKNVKSRSFIAGDEKANEIKHFFINPG